MSTSGSSADPTNGWVLFDGECGFCSRWLQFWQPTLAKHGFDSVALQETWVTKKLQLPADQLLYDIRLLAPDGKLISGADVYLQVTNESGGRGPSMLFSACRDLTGSFIPAIDGLPETATVFPMPANCIRLVTIVFHDAKLNC